MNKQPVLFFVKNLNRSVFTTNEVALVSGKSLSVVTQSLNTLQKQGLVLKIYRGIWAQTGAKDISPYNVIPFLFSRHRAYVSFISALHLYGIIEQIPQVITLASTAHTRVIHTGIGVFSVHRIMPEFFEGFNWYRGTESFLIAEPEKALVDSLYLSACRKNQFGHFPELHFPKTFSFKKAKNWVERIPNSSIAAAVQKKLKNIGDIFNKEVVRVPVTHKRGKMPDAGELHEEN